MITALFVALAATLVSLAVILALNLAGALDRLMVQAETPHFMQMHSGPLDTEPVNRFVSQHEAVDRYQILEFLNIDNSEIELNGHSLISSTQDNGFSTQSGAFDYLLDLDGAVITPAGGEIYVPVCYMQEAAMKTGDIVSVCGIPFRTAGFLRDSQMNSMLSSSKRFLVSPQDFERLRSLGTMEHLIEFRLKDLSALDAFAADYTAAGLPSSGPAVTYPLFRLLLLIRRHDDRRDPASRLPDRSDCLLMHSLYASGPVRIRLPGTGCDEGNRPARLRHKEAVSRQICSDRRIRMHGRHRFFIPA